MSKESRWASRYHWLAETVDDFVCEPHAAVQDLAEAATGPKMQLTLLNMVAEEAGENRHASAALVRENPDWLLDQIEQYTEGPTLFAPTRHPVLKLDINQKRLRDIVVRAHERYPTDFETLLGIEGIGPASFRSLALLAEIIFQAPPSRRDVTTAQAASADPDSDLTTPIGRLRCPNCVGRYTSVENCVLPGAGGGRHRRKLAVTGGRSASSRCGAGLMRHYGRVHPPRSALRRSGSMKEVTGNFSWNTRTADRRTETVKWGVSSKVKISKEVIAGGLIGHSPADNVSTARAMASPISR